MRLKRWSGCSAALLLTLVAWLPEGTAGRAMTRRFAVQASYVQHIIGSETFSRGFQLGFNYFWGPNRGR